MCHAPQFIYWQPADFQDLNHFEWLWPHITQSIVCAVLTRSLDRPFFASRGIGHSHQFFHYDPQTAGGILEHFELRCLNLFYIGFKHGWEMLEGFMFLGPWFSKRGCLQIPSPWAQMGHTQVARDSMFWKVACVKHHVLTVSDSQCSLLRPMVNWCLTKNPSIVITLEKLWGWCHQGVAGYLFLSHATSRGHCACHVECSLDESSSYRVSRWPSPPSDSL